MISSLSLCFYLTEVSSIYEPERRDVKTGIKKEYKKTEDDCCRRRRRCSRAPCACMRCRFSLEDGGRYRASYYLGTTRF